MYAVVEVLCIHNLDCGDAIHHISTYGAVEMWKMCDKDLTDLHVHIP